MEIQLINEVGMTGLLGCWYDSMHEGRLVINGFFVAGKQHDRAGGYPGTFIWGYVET